MMGDMTRVRDLMLKPNAVFVFGSNVAGRHGLGAARTARQAYGARYGQGEGLAGRSYAIPTKDEFLQSLPLLAIESRVVRFLLFAGDHPDLLFVVTRLGTGYAGYTDAQIGPLFRDAPSNVMLPEGWG